MTRAEGTEPADRRACDAAGSFPGVAAASVPWLTVGEMRAIDEIAVGRLGIDLLQMMENAGRSLAVLTRCFLGGSVAGRRIAILAGPGGNGGGGLAAARHLLAAGARPEVWLSTSRTRLVAATRRQLAILERLEVTIRHDPSPGLGNPDVVLDALLGYSQAGPARGGAASLIEAARGARVLALDTPSGLELESGHVLEPYVRAEATLTLAAPKAGLQGRDGRRAAGTLFLADIAIPPAAFEQIGRGHEPPFARSPIVRITPRRESSADRGVSNRAWVCRAVVEGVS